MVYLHFLYFIIEKFVNKVAHNEQGLLQFGK
jgi:hypothetical protein